VNQPARPVAVGNQLSGCPQGCPTVDNVVHRNPLKIREFSFETVGGRVYR
jgi:hypothetical protein